MDFPNKLKLKLIAYLLEHYRVTETETNVDRTEALIAKDTK